ncbi:oxidoreductase [Clostridium beijerinckii]|nr:oxidoreductase [Clostridium beijerinckii]
MKKRVLGKTGENLSVVGFGGIIVSAETQKDANNYVAEAIDSGVNYFDVAPTYGNAQDKLGPALVGKRNDIFLACKTENRTKDGARALLEESLKILKTDYFDLYQLHAVTTTEDVEKIFGVNGAFETFLKAKQEGLIKHIGFSAHSEEAAIALMDRFDFDSILFPVNWVNIINSDFGPKVIAKAKEKEMGILAIKAMAKTKLEEGVVNKYPKGWYEAIDDKELAKLAYRYTLSQPITAAIPPGDIEHFRWSVEAARDFKPVTEEEINLLKEKCKGMKSLFPLK